MDENKRCKPIPQEVSELGQRIAQWRLGRVGSTPMPEELWRDAATAATHFGVSLVARVLNLGHGVLKRRTDALQVRPVVTGGFMELRGEDILGVGSTMVELSAPDGARLSLSVPASAPFDVAAVVAAFRWRA